MLKALSDTFRLWLMTVFVGIAEAGTQKQVVRFASLTRQS
jgi:hypothetical protein